MFGIRAKLIYRWYDMYFGVYIDTKKRIVYIFPLPCFGIMAWREQRKKT